MKKSIKNILFGIGSLVLAIAVAVFNSSAAKSAPFLGVVSGILAAAAVVFFVIEGFERNKNYKAERQQINEANKEYFEDAEEVDVFSTARMFADEFDDTESHSEELETVEEDVKDNRNDYIDTSFSFSDAASEFVKFAQERGFKLDNGVAESIFASMATSKLIFVNGMDEESFNSFMVILSEYFGTDTYVDSEEDGEGNNFFYSYDSHGDFVKKNILVAMEASRTAPETAFIAALNGASAAGALEYVKPFSKYMQSNKQKNEISIFNEHGSNMGCNIGANLWLVVNLKATECIDDVPVWLLRFASALNIAHAKCQKAETVTAVHGLCRYQLDYILEKQGAKNEIPEEIYKKVDRLEKYACDHSMYNVGNKLLLSFERYVSLLLSCETDVSSAADSAVAVKILPSLLSSINGTLTNEDRTVAEMVEFIFGEEHVVFSKAFLDIVAASRAEKARVEAEALRLKEENEARLREEAAAKLRAAEEEANLRAAEAKKAAEELEKEGSAEEAPESKAEVAQEDSSVSKQAEGETTEAVNQIEEKSEDKPEENTVKIDKEEVSEKAEAEEAAEEAPTVVKEAIEEAATEEDDVSEVSSEKSEQDEERGEQDQNPEENKEEAEPIAEDSANQDKTE